MISIIPKPSSVNLPVITPLFNGNPRSCFSPFRIKFHRRRRRFQFQASSLVLPLLPFPIDQVLVPSEAKTIHLYEARYIALLEESLFKKNKLFVHFVLDPIGLSGISAEASFAARYGCLVIIEKVERLEIGALVLIRGVGRVKLLEFQQTEPYLTGQVTPLQDSLSYNLTETSSEVLELKAALQRLNSLEIKLKAPVDALLQTQTKNSLLWADKQLSLDCSKDFVPPVAERVSFVALQPVSGATETELMNLQKEKLKAMDVKDTLERLERSLELVSNNVAMLAARLAIQSLGMP